MAAQVRRALPVDRDRDDARRRATPACGTRRTASSTTSCARPTARAERLKVRSMVGPAAALRGDRASTARLLRRHPALAERMRRVPRRPARAAHVHPRPGPARASTAGGSRRSSTRRSCGGSWRRCSTRPSSSARTASGRCRATTGAPVRLRGRRPGVPGRLPAGRIRQRDVRRQLQLARPDLDAGQRADHPGAAPVPQLLRRRVHDRVPDRSGRTDEPVRGRRGDRPPARVDLPARRDGHRPVYGGTRDVPGRPGLARPSCSTSTSTATTAPASARATRPAGPASSRGSSTCSRATFPTASRPSRRMERGLGGRCRRRLKRWPDPGGTSGTCREIMVVSKRV